MTVDSPAEALEIRGKSLTPVSPKPLLFPSPSNIPILEMEMDTDFAEIDIPATDASSTDPGILQQMGVPSGISPTLENGHTIQYTAVLDGITGMINQVDSSKSMERPANETLTEANHNTAVAPSEVDSAASATEPAPILYASQDVPDSSPSLPLQASIGIESSENATYDGSRPTAEGTDEGGVNIQTLLDNLAATTAATSIPQAQLSDPSTSHVDIPNLAGAVDNNLLANALAGNSGLPPRPPPQETAASSLSYSAGDEHRPFVPVAQQSQNPPQPTSFRPQSSAAPALSVGANGLSPPPIASFQAPLTSPTLQLNPESPAIAKDTIERADEDNDADDEVEWSPETQKIYEDFLHDERAYVTEGQWDKFPANSRLFIGNLPTEKVSKRDLFQIFYNHGKLAQISIKQAFGFIQFLDANACSRALHSEQGVAVRGRKMHLEISKPQKNSRGGGGGDGNKHRRRSRSNEHARGSGTGSGPRAADRYTGTANGASPRDRDFRRGRDDYRPPRSPSPRGYRRDRSRDRYDGGGVGNGGGGGARRRSRSRSPHRRGGRYRSPSPRKEPDDELPLPRRAPRDVPDIQMIVIDDLDRNFIAFLERAFQERGVRCDVLLLSPRLSERAVVRRQIIEGVSAVSKITRANQQTGRIPLQVFDRRGGNDNVRFEEYDNLEPSVCAELVNRAKQTNSQVSSPFGVPVSYGMAAQYGLPLSQIPHNPAVAAAAAPPTPAGANPNISNLITSLDGAGLQKLIGAIQQPQGPGAAPSVLTPDLARLLGGAPAHLHGQAQPPLYGQQTPAAPASNPYAALAANPALARLLSGAAPAGPGAPLHVQHHLPGGAPVHQQHQHQNQQHQHQHQHQHQQHPSHAPVPNQPDVQEIMAQLAKYRR